MRTSTHTSLNKLVIRVTHEYRLTPTERDTLILISKGLYSWGKPGHANFRQCDDKMDESRKVQQKPCHALATIGLLESDPMACHGYQFNITALGWCAAQHWSSVAGGLSLDIPQLMVRQGANQSIQP